MQVTLDGTDYNFAGGFSVFLHQIGLQCIHTHVHSTSRYKNFRYKNLIVLKLLTNDIHTTHQTFFQNALGGQTFFGMTAENILREAQEKAKQMVTKEAIYQEAKKRSEELVGQTQNRINQLRKAGNEYMDESLRQTEEAIAQALSEVRETRMKFRTVTEAQEQRRTANVDVEV